MDAEGPKQEIAGVRTKSLLHPLLNPVSRVRDGLKLEQLQVVDCSFRHTLSECSSNLSFQPDIQRSCFNEERTEQAGAT